MALITERLILREWAMGDIEDIVDGLNNIEVSKWLAYIPCPYTLEDAAAWVRSCEENKASYHFAIVLKESGKVIGGTSLESISKLHGTARGGIWLNANYHGNGYGVEAWGSRIEFAFETLGLRRLENGFFEGNLASQKMQEKFGYVIEGKRRKAYRCMADGEYKDEIMTGLLKEEWKRST